MKATTKCKNSFLKKSLLLIACSLACKKGAYLMYTLTWIAIAMLCVSYWFQIYKIHVHKEVRDLSLTYHILLATGFAILAGTAWYEGSVAFFVKQIATTIPVLVIIGQILYHKEDPWHDDAQIHCSKYDEELEDDWCHCPYCGIERC